MMLTIVVLCAVSVAGVAQSPLRFEVASVKPTRSSEGFTVIRQNEGGRFVADGITVSNLIQQAHDLYSFQIVGAPDWLNAIGSTSKRLRHRARALWNVVRFSDSYSKIDSCFGHTARSENVMSTPS
jgi:hypothetical protein